MTRQRVIVGFSGGYASAVAAFLLSRQNYEVLGIYLKLKESDIEEESKAISLAEKFDIPIKVYNLEAQEFIGLENYAEAEFVNEHPDLEYHRNQFVLSSLAKIADELGIQYIGTGHILKKNYLLKEKEYVLYSTANWENMQTHLVAGMDLARLLMPLGDLSQEDIKKICAELGVDYSYFTRTDQVSIEVNKDPFVRGEGKFAIILKDTRYYKKDYQSCDSYIYINRTHQVIRSFVQFKPFHQAFLEVLEVLDIKIGEEIFIFENSSGANKRLVGFGSVQKTIDKTDENQDQEGDNGKSSYEYF